MRLLDTNIIIRFLTGDDESKAEACRRLFLRLDSLEEEAFCSESVIAEVFYVLRSSRIYGVERSEAAAQVRPVITTRGLRFPSKQLILRAIDFFEAHNRLDFEDALTLAHMEAEGVAEVYSYDQDFDRIQGVRRIEPPS